MTASQTRAQSLSASPSVTSYPTTQFSLPPSYHHEISDLSAYNRSFPPKIKCCVDRLSWLHSGQNVAVPRMSAKCHVWTTPAVQGKNLAFQRSVRVQPCIRPLNAAVVAAGPDVIRRSGRKQKHAL